MDGRPEIFLSHTAGELLEVDVLAYPEDTYLIVDPYSTLDLPEAGSSDIIAEAEATLPRPLGEIITTKTKDMTATWLLRLVLLDFNRQKHCRAKTVEEILCQLVWQATLLKAQRLGLDRFELLQPCVSAYLVLSCLCKQITKVRAAGNSPPTALVFSIHQPSVLRHYELALTNLPRGD